MDHGFYPTNLDGEGLRIGIVQTRFNKPVCEALHGTCVAELKQLGVAGENVLLIIIPGTLEVPLALQKMAGSGQSDALIALGTVIRDETYHLELVSNESGTGITRVDLDFNVAIANGIPTTDTGAQAHARTREEDHDCTHTAVEVVSLTNDLDGLRDHSQDDDGEDE